jgi:hypothetical protein
MLRDRGESRAWAIGTAHPRTTCVDAWIGLDRLQQEGLARREVGSAHCSRIYLKYLRRASYCTVEPAARRPRAARSLARHSERGRAPTWASPVNARRARPAAAVTASTENRIRCVPPLPLVSIAIRVQTTLPFASHLRPENHRPCSLQRSTTSVRLAGASRNGLDPAAPGLPCFGVGKSDKFRLQLTISNLSNSS